MKRKMTLSDISKPEKAVLCFGFIWTIVTCILAGRVYLPHFFYPISWLITVISIFGPFITAILRFAKNSDE